MKKKLLVLIACFVTCLAMTGCGASMSYDDYDLNEYIEVGKYKKLKTEGYEISVTEKEIQERIDSILNESVESVEIDKDDKIKDGDTVNIDYKGTKDGEAFDGGSAEGHELVIGSNSFIDGFEDGLIGKKTGDHVKLNLTFPEDYSEASLAGQDVVFEVTINSAKRDVIPEYNLDFVTSHTDYKSIEEYEDAVEKVIYNDKESQALAELQEDLWSQALKNTEVKKYPEREVEHYIAFNNQQMEDTAEAYGMTKEEVLTQYGFSNQEEFDSVNDESSKLRVKQEMLLEYIAKEEGIEPTKEKEEEVLEKIMEQGYDEKAIETSTGRPADEYAHVEALYQTVLEFLYDKAIIE